MDDTSINQTAPVDPDLKQWADLGLPEMAAGTVLWSNKQQVEPTRDGEPWCDWPEAEDMLVNSALPTMRGLFGIHPAGYRVTRDDSVMTLQLELLG